MSEGLARILTEEIWPMPLVRLPLWARVVAWLGCVPILCMLALLVIRLHEAQGMVREGIVVLAVWYPPLAVAMLGLNLAFKRALRHRRRGAGKFCKKEQEGGPADGII